MDAGSLVFIPITPELWNFSKPVDFDRVKGGVAFKVIKTVSVMCELAVVVKAARVERSWAGDDDNLIDFVIMEEDNISVAGTPISKLVPLLLPAAVSFDDNNESGECTSSVLSNNTGDVSLIPGDRISGIAVVCCDSVCCDSDVIRLDNLKSVDSNFISVEVDFLISIVSNEWKDDTALYVVVEGAMMVSTPDDKISGMALVCCGSVLCEVVILLDNL